MTYTPGLTSIIVGCYNVDSWLREKRLSCLRQQSYKQIELILVDDGSTDDTPHLLHELSDEDVRIRIITKENGGLGSARNAGLDAAQGEFIWFYDVDDEADLCLVEKNVEWMTTYHTDLNVFGFVATTVNTGGSETISFPNKLIESNAQLHEIFLDTLFFVRYGNGFAWNKFYRREFLERHHIRFGHQRIQQDELFNLQVYPHAERVYLSSKPLYHYFIYEQGNTRSRYIPDRYSIHLSIYEGIRQFAQRWHVTDERLHAHAVRRLYDGMSQSICFNTFHPDAPLNRNEQQEEIVRILRHPMSQMCINYMHYHRPKSVESLLYLQAFQRKSVWSIRFLRWCFRSVRFLNYSLNNIYARVMKQTK